MKKVDFFKIFMAKNNNRRILKGLLFNTNVELYANCLNMYQTLFLLVDPLVIKMGSLIKNKLANNLLNHILNGSYFTFFTSNKLVNFI